MAETSGCCPASAEADYMIKVIVLRVRRATASSGLPPNKMSNFAQIPREGAPIVNSGSAPHI